MPDLPRVSEEFTADASGFIAALQSMIDQAERLAAAIDEDIAKIAELKAAIDSLPDTKVVNVIYRVTTEGGPPGAGPTPGGTGDIARETEALRQMADAAAAAGAQTANLGAQTQETAADIAAETRALADMAGQAQGAAATQDQLAAATRRARTESEGLINDTFRVNLAIYEAELELRDIIKAEEELAAQMGSLSAQELEEAAAEARVTLAVIEHDLELEKLRASYEATTAAINQNDLAIQQNQQVLNSANAAVVASAVENAKLAAAQAVLAGNQGTANAIIAGALPLLAALGTQATNTSAPINMLATALANGSRGAMTFGAGLNTLTQAAVNGNAAAQNFTQLVGAGVPAMVAFAMAAKNAGSNVGGMLIPLGAAAFGITSIATAIHLIVMGVFEFLAVFVPAMYAAGAAAAVLYQGIMERVVPGMRSLRTAAEALGPTFNTTAGDMLGLGHTLQTAQNMANPIAYTLLGEAILSVKYATQQTTPGLSAIGQTGLAVGRILEGFGAKFAVDLRDNMGMVHSLLANSVADLVMFGQILGNIGHALLNFASAMPGLAEVILRIVDGLSQLLKWLSSLPTGFLTAIFVIEEMYRWSGLLVGVFGMLGRAIALVGTLGIPVFVKIGANVGMMAANVLSGVAGMIVNFMSLLETVGLVGARVDAMALRVVTSLLKVAEFMKGPWGIGIGLGIVAIGALVFWMSRWKSATDEFVASAQKAVQAASNLQVLNVIGQQLNLTLNQLAQANDSFDQATRAASASAGTVASRYTGVSQSVDQAAGSIRTLTAEQQNLWNQNQNVIQGAIAISKEYGVNFTAALAMADAAGVKLANGFTGQSKAAQQAQIQVQALYLGYQKMDLTGSALSNTMNALNIQAGLQNTQVSKVNQAWDQFISMATSLTGSFTQFNLDLQQMGNSAAVVGGRIRAFSGTTQLSVGQIAAALQSFGGSSAQIWQAFNQSIAQANTFMDSLRTAAAAGVVPQQQFTQAIATVVGQLLPYARLSRAALAEVDALAQEAGGPATTSFQTLKEWVDRNAVSSDKFTGMIDNLTQKLSNVTQVARNFAGTLQTDVLNAIANTAVGTANITGLTQKYTQALMDNGPQAQSTKNAQAQFNSELLKLGFTHKEVTQLDNELTTAYGRNSGAANTAAGYTGLLAGAMDTARKNHMDPFGQDIRNITSWYWGMQKALANWPTKESTTVQVTGTGGASVTSTVQGVPGGRVSVTGLPTGSRFAHGGVIPGYSPGHDTVMAMLSPGEGVLTPQAVRMLGPGAVEHINRSAQHFATGGLVMPDVSGWAQHYLATTDKDISAAFGKVLATSVASVAATAKQQVSGISVPGHPSGSVMSWMAQAMALTGVPQSWLPDLLTIAFYESGQNPNAINLTDSNAAAGDPSRGLMQVIMSTFLGYHQPGTSFNIYDPVANIAAAIRYIEGRYGSVFNVPGIVSLSHGGKYIGYDSGGYLMPGLTLAYNGTGRPERVTAPGAGGEPNIIHNVVNLDGQAIWENQQQYTLRYSLRNSGVASGVWSPL